MCLQSKYRSTVLVLFVVEFSGVVVVRSRGEGCLARSVAHGETEWALPIIA